MKIIRPLQEAKNWFLQIFKKNIGGFFSMKEVVFQISNLNSLFRGAKTIFWAKVFAEVWSSFKSTLKPLDLNTIRPKPKRSDISDFAGGRALFLCLWVQ